jgi:purine-nucleoside phosphorylase
MSVHIGAAKGEIAERILLPGDPLRAKWVAENYLENVKQYNSVRNMFGFTGTYKGERISVQGTGMGLPSASIYVTELFNEYDVQVAIRIGTAGGLQDKTKVGFSNDRFNGFQYQPSLHKRSGLCAKLRFPFIDGGL